MPPKNLGPPSSSPSLCSFLCFTSNFLGLTSFHSPAVSLDLVQFGISDPGGRSNPTNQHDSNPDSLLDRAVANASFSQLFENCTVDNFITTSSDHYAVLITLVQDPRRTARRPVSSSFRYEAFWRWAPDYKDTLEAAWDASSEGPFSLQSTWAKLNRTDAEGLELGHFRVGEEEEDQTFGTAVVLLTWPTSV
jgi:hypothetical protein